MFDSNNIVWNKELSAKVWDNYLAALGGHPLQSALWGNARQQVDGIENHRWAAFVKGQLIFMARFEVRKIPFLGRVAWIPKGPVVGISPLAQKTYNEFLCRLRDKKYPLCIQDPYPNVFDFIKGKRLLPQPRTVWVDLVRGKERLWKELQREWRRGVNIARQKGVMIEEMQNRDDVTKFFSLCKNLSKYKHFLLPASESIMHTLVVIPKNTSVKTKLFVARLQDNIIAGVLVLCSGSSLHEMWAASDRNFSSHRANELLQWSIIEQAIDNGFKKYDLEGVDPISNPGVYQFKRKMGGSEITLPGKYAYPLNRKGKIALNAWRLLRRI